MYEKPQYMTLAGLRRLKEPPGLIAQKKLIERRKFYSKFSTAPKSMSISPQAAGLIASAIKGMIKK